MKTVWLILLCVALFGAGLGGGVAIGKLFPIPGSFTVSSVTVNDVTFTEYDYLLGTYTASPPAMVRAVDNIFGHDVLKVWQQNEGKYLVILLQNSSSDSYVMSFRDASYTSICSVTVDSEETPVTSATEMTSGSDVFSFTF